MIMVLNISPFYFISFFFEYFQVALLHAYIFRIASSWDTNLFILKKCLFFSSTTTYFNSRIFIWFFFISSLVRFSISSLWFCFSFISYINNGFIIFNIWIILSFYWHFYWIAFPCYFMPSNMSLYSSHCILYITDTPDLLFSERSWGFALAHS